MTTSHCKKINISEKKGLRDYTSYPCYHLENWVQFGQHAPRLLRLLVFRITSVIFSNEEDYYGDDGETNSNEVG